MDDLTLSICGIRCSFQQQRSVGACGERRRLPTRVLAAEIGIADPEFDEATGTDVVAGAEQGGEVDVERGVSLGATEKHAHGADALEHAVGRGPGPALLEQVQADLARLQTDVGVHHGRGEGDLRRLERVRGRDGYAEEPAAFCLWGKRGRADG